MRPEVNTSEIGEVKSKEYMKASPPQTSLVCLILCLTHVYLTHVYVPGSPRYVRLRRVYRKLYAHSFQQGAARLVEPAVDEEEVPVDLTVG